MQVRPTQSQDIAALEAVLDQIELFPSEMLPDMIAGFLAGGDDMWLTCTLDERVVGFCYAIPEEMAAGTWNMLAIGVLPEEQGTGCGTALVKHLEETLRQQKQRIMIVDTSGTDAFSKSREFYCKNGYAEEARIRDFWAAGDDKITFWKSLS
ncbi:GNAT family N-acetyltransferase [Falsihalocynthiibacter sp. SS001]|uniref:GNAT family N-acetyltransferase n=1 Tax=Falsihalocynthiibacter sp. SS001 TaxID=3349698 RepID=UPI0036D2B082